MLLWEPEGALDVEAELSANPPISTSQPCGHFLCRTSAFSSAVLGGGGHESRWLLGWVVWCQELLLRDAPSLGAHPQLWDLD